MASLARKDGGEEEREGREQVDVQARGGRGRVERGGRAELSFATVRVSDFLLLHCVR